MKAKNLDIYGHEPLARSRVLDQLHRTDYKATHWLATTGPDGRPHVAGVGAMWDSGKFYIVSGPKTRKSRNLAENNHCVIAVSMPNVDLVMEGTAAMVSDPATLKRLAKRYVDVGWPAEARDGAIVAPYSASSAGPGPLEAVRVQSDHCDRRGERGATWRHSLAASGQRLIPPRDRVMILEANP